MKTNTKSKTASTKAIYERRLITAIHDSSPDSNTTPEIEIIENKENSPNIEIKEKKNNIWYAKQVLTEAKGKISIDDAAIALLKIHTLRTEKPENQAKKIFLHTKLPVKFTKENGVKYIELEV